MADNNYDSGDLEVLEGLEPVRKRPGMYIGSTGKTGFHHLAWEIIDNSVDEAIGGHADHIDVMIHQDGSLSVRDNGRGIPVSPMPSGPQKGTPAVQVMFSMLHAGGKFGGSAYGYSGGLHGVGTSVVNALSEWVDIEVARNGEVHHLAFATTEVETDDGIEKLIPGKLTQPIEIVRSTDSEWEQGTMVRFLPDSRVFSTSRWDDALISNRLRNAALLNAGLTTTLTRYDMDGEKVYEEFNFPNGLSDFMRIIQEDRIEAKMEALGISSDDPVETEKSDEEALDQRTQPLLDQPLHFTGGDEEVGEWEIHLQWLPDTEYTVDSFVNSVRTGDGGTHVDGFQLALTKLINTYSRQEHIGLLGERDPNLDASDIRSGLAAIVAAKVKEPQFEGQTKGRLGNDTVKRMVRSGLYDAMWSWMEQHPAEIAVVIHKMIFEMRTRYKLAAAAERERNASEPRGTQAAAEAPPSKLIDCTSTDRKSCELFLVEGDSAGGTAKAARNRETQAILPLRGKILNVEMLHSGSEKSRASMKNRIDTSQELQGLINAIGAGSEDFCDPSLSRYGKIILLMDADDDGRHIQILAMTAIIRLLRPMVEQGMLYVCRTPLFGVTYKDTKLYAYNMEERNQFEEKYGQLKWTRFKGLGEMDAEVLEEMALNPDTRRVVRVEVEDMEAASRITTDLMGNDSSTKWDALQETTLESEDIVNA